MTCLALSLPSDSLGSCQVCKVLCFCFFYYLCVCFLSSRVLFKNSLVAKRRSYSLPGVKKKKLITCKDQGWVFTSQQQCWQLEGYGALSSIVWRKIKARTFYPAKLGSKCEGRIMTLSDIQVFQEPAGGRWFTEIKE